MQTSSRFVLITAGLAWLMPGCSDSPRHHGPGPGPGQMAAPAPIPGMTAEAPFAGGQLLVQATLASGPQGPGPAGGVAGGPGNRRPPRPLDPEDEPVDDRPMGPRMHDSPMPVIVLRLHVNNQGPEPIDVTFVECSSALGNFGITPGKVSLQPGQSVDLDPMRSLLGITGEDLPITVTLRIKGKVEKQVLTLHVSSS